MTISDIEAMDKPFLLAADVAEFLKMKPQNIRCQAHADPSKLGFPVIVVGTRVRIPKDAFIKFLKGNLT